MGLAQPKAVTAAIADNDIWAVGFSDLTA